MTDTKSLVERLRPQIHAALISFFQDYDLGSLQPGNRVSSAHNRVMAVIEEEAATFIEGSGGVTEADMAAFGASYYACYKYPGKDQSKERAAFCEGVAYSALSGAGVTEGMTPEELIAEHSQGHPKLRENCPTCLASPVSRSPSAGGGEATIQNIASDISKELGQLLDDSYLGKYSKRDEQIKTVLWDNKIGILRVLQHVALTQPSSREETPGGWRDIASAPKDGTLIVGYIPDSAALTDELLMEWDEEDGAWRQMGTHSSFLVEVEPSHWMPLPAPPHKEGT